jgi:hypothetical protein
MVFVHLHVRNGSITVMMTASRTITPPQPPSPITLNHHLISGYESNEQDRPQFEGEGILSPIDGKPMLYFAKADKDYRVRIANVSTAKRGGLTGIPEG